MNRNTVVIVVLILVVTGMLVAGKYLVRKSGPAVAAAGNVKGQMAPDFELKELDGHLLRLSDLRGKAVLLNFWATWCGPCKIEVPWFVELQKQYGPQGLQIVGVSMDDNSSDDVMKFAMDMGINYPVVMGDDKIAGAYGGVQALPTTFYIGRDGKVVSRVYGLVSHSEVESNIRAALNQGQAVAANAAGR